MKKFVTTLVLSLLTAFGAFAFSACGSNVGNEENEENEENKQPVYTVTAEEWSSAVTYITEAKNNIKCACTREAEDSEITMSFTYDSANKILYIINNDEEHKIERYSWVIGNNAYHWFNGKKSNMHMEDYNDAIIQYHKHYGGGNVIEKVDLANKYSSFTYNENSKEYTATLQVEGVSVNYGLKFADGKLAELTTKQTEESYTCIYTYGISLTIPSDILNAEV